ncbi:hypothetical protein E3N88_23330 [Mikania micrantha]|uniref:Uncharacterized protein n=1 Tax=Mikania micrantha TaxID=192012 RepID=A0A5N6NE45_9ASTR|nr:hypothetical protein E3N88_23330 [Mikania micrantha]
MGKVEEEYVWYLEPWDENVSTLPDGIVDSSMEHVEDDDALATVDDVEATVVMVYLSFNLTEIFEFHRPRCYTDNRSPFAMGIGSTRCFSDGLTHLPEIKDGDIKLAFKELMAVNWDELPDTVVNKTNRALSKNTEDKTSQEALANLLRAAEAVEEFSGFLVTLKMEIDDSVGMSGENVKPLTDEVANALRLAFGRYYAYLDSFGPGEGYLRKKVENELGMKLIHLKMRCSGLGGDWGKILLPWFKALCLANNPEFVEV